MKLKYEWPNQRIEEMEEKAKNMGLSFQKPYDGQEEAYVRALSGRLMCVLEQAFYEPQNFDGF